MSSAESPSNTYTAHLTHWFKGNLLAVQFIEHITDSLHCWDDLIDRDKPVPAETIHQTFWNLCIALPRNAFYMQNFSVLNGVLQQAILNWHIANKMELTGDELDKQIAFVLRSSYIDLVTACAWCIAGERWALQVGYEARHATSSEGYLVYRERLLHERRSDALMQGEA